MIEEAGEGAESDIEGSDLIRHGHGPFGSLAGGSLEDEAGMCGDALSHDKGCFEQLTVPCMMAHDGTAANLDEYSEEDMEAESVQSREADHPFSLEHALHSVDQAATPLKSRSLHPEFPANPGLDVSLGSGQVYPSANAQVAGQSPFAAGLGPSAASSPEVDTPELGLECLERLPSDLLIDSSSDQGCFVSITMAERVHSKGLSRFAPSATVTQRATTECLGASSSGNLTITNPQSTLQQAFLNCSVLPDLCKDVPAGSPEMDRSKLSDGEKSEALTGSKMFSQQLVEAEQPDQYPCQSGEQLSDENENCRAQRYSPGLQKLPGLSDLQDTAIPASVSRVPLPSSSLECGAHPAEGTDSEGPVLDVPEDSALEGMNCLTSKLQGCTLDGGLSAELAAITVPSSLSAAVDVRQEPLCEVGPVPQPAEVTSPTLPSPKLFTSRLRMPESSTLPPREMEPAQEDATEKIRSVPLYLNSLPVLLTDLTKFKSKLLSNAALPGFLSWITSLEIQQKSERTLPLKLSRTVYPRGTSHACNLLHQSLKITPPITERC